MMEGSVVTVQAKGGASADVPPITGASNSRVGQRAPHLAMRKYLDHDLSLNVLF